MNAVHRAQSGSLLQSHRRFCAFLRTRSEGAPSSFVPAYSPVIPSKPALQVVKGQVFGKNSTFHESWLSLMSVQVDTYRSIATGRLRSRRPGTAARNPLSVQLSRALRSACCLTLISTFSLKCLFATNFFINSSIVMMIPSLLAINVALSCFVMFGAPRIFSMSLPKSFLTAARSCFNKHSVRLWFLSFFR